jgi:type IV pilus assembly protein PilB
MARKKLGEMLVEAGVLTEAGLRAALAEQRRWGGTLGRTLVDMRQLKEEDLVAVLSRQLGLPTIDLDAVMLPPAVVELVPSELATQYSLVAFARDGATLDVAVSDPTNTGVIDELALRTQLTIRTHLAGPKMIERTIRRCYGRGHTQRIEHILDTPAEAPAPAPRDAEINALQARIARLETTVARDAELLRKLLGLLVEKGLVSRDEFLNRLD